MSIKIDVPPGELIDKLTILEIKIEQITDPDKLRNIKLEYAVLSQILVAEIADDSALMELRSELKALNKIIWKVEDDLREFERKQIFDDGFIQAARTVYFKNDERARMKRLINEHLGSRLLEEKSHAPY